MSPPIVIFLSISLFMSLNICFIYLGALILGACIFNMCYICLYWLLYQSLFLCNMSIAFPGFFSLSFAWISFSILFFQFLRPPVFWTFTVKCIGVSHFLKSLDWTFCGSFQSGKSCFSILWTILHGTHHNFILSSITFQKFYFLDSKLIKLTLFSDVVLLFSIYHFFLLFWASEIFCPFSKLFWSLTPS